MIVFRDQPRVWNVRDAVERIRGIDDPVTSLIEIGKLVQGIADQGVHSHALHELLLVAGSNLRGRSPLPWDALDLDLLPEQIEVTEPEGYAFYAVHPALYVAAAEALLQRLRKSGREPKSWLVVGIR